MKHTYIHETHTLYCLEGELHIEYGDTDNPSTLVINCEQLYKDLPYIITQVIKEQDKTHKMYKDLIKQSLKDITG